MIAGGAGGICCRRRGQEGRRLEGGEEMLLSRDLHSKRCGGARASARRTGMGRGKGAASGAGGWEFEAK